MPTSPALAARALWRVVAAACTGALLAGAATTVLLTGYPALSGGGAALAVLSGSMAPGMPAGSMVLTRPVEPADLEVGDVVTFRRGDVLVTHRVRAVLDGPAFVTRGDANDSDDLLPVAAADVVGRRWTSVPGLGRLAAEVRSQRGAGVVVLLVCAALAAPGSVPRGRQTSRPAIAAASRGAASS